MATFYALGKYTAQGYQGFCKDPKSDRAQAARTAAEAEIGRASCRERV